MNMNKYKLLLFNKIKDQLSLWFEKEPQKPATKEEVFLFLHSIKGTAGTIELGGLFTLVTNLMNEIERNDSKLEWEKHELRDFLYELMDLSYQYEHFETIDISQPIKRDEGIPLIQVIDDDISMLILLKDTLEEMGWIVVAHTDALVGKELFYELQPDCLIIDVNLPGKNGYQFLQELEHHLSKLFIPTVMISIENKRETRIKAIESGADDFIEKPLDLEEFVLRVKRQLNRKKLFDQSVMIDELTKVYNRRFLNDSLDRALKDIERSSTYFTIAVLDLDYFKKVNDTYGHIAGDEVLQTFARFLKEHLRGTDSVFRFGGEEFVILFPKTNDTDAKSVLSRLLEKFFNLPFMVHGNTFHVSFSAGVFMVLDEKMDSKTVMKIADQALYVAKENGRARVESANQLNLGAAKKTLHVSIIDDDVIIRTMLSKILQNMEFEFVELDICAYEDGMKFFDSGRHEVSGQHFLVLDGVMPVMDGTEVLQKVKGSRKRKQFHVLMLTGRKNEQDIARSLRLGADDYVTKPFSIQDLQARIYSFIQRITK
jgi:two-component system, cell cycle response regulator